MRRRLVLVTTALLALATSAFAQEMSNVEINLGAGFTVPQSDSKNSFGTGGNFQLGAVINLTPTLAFQANYFYNRFGSKTFAANPCVPTAAAGEVCASIPFSLNHSMHDGDFSLLVSAPRGKMLTPYGIAGVGVYHHIVNLTTTSVGLGSVCDPWIYICYPSLVPVETLVGDRTSTDFGMNFGGGVLIPIGDLAHFYAETRYIHTWGPTVRRSPIRRRAQA
jgi:opacity protein-like surface antigen